MSEKNKSGRSGKDIIRNPDMNVAEESDRLEVPEKTVNEAKAEEPLEGRSRAKENTAESAAGLTQSEQTALMGLRRVRQRCNESRSSALILC